MSKRKRITIKLDSIIDLSAKLIGLQKEERVLNTALLSVMGKLKIIRGIVLIPDNNNNFKPLIIKGKANISEIPFLMFNEFHTLKKTKNIEKQLVESGYMYCLPIIYQEKLLAIIYLGDSLDHKNLQKDEIYYAKIVASVTSIALQNISNSQSLIEAKNNVEHRNLLLTSMFEMSKDFSTLLSRNHILRMLSYRLMGQLMVSRFLIILINDKCKKEVIINRFDKPLPELVINHFFQFNQTELIQIYGREEIDEILEKIDAKIVSPLIVQGKIKGVLVVGKKMSNEDFTDENLQFIEVLGNTAMSALENERLFEQELEKKQLEKELQLALDIQKNLLPDKNPEIDNFDIVGCSYPSRHVGGDYFDFIPVSSNELLIAIADVSGKGMPAALLMANVQAALKVLAPLHFSLKELVERLNSIVYQNTSPDKFVTFFCGILNFHSNNFHYLNAGHNPPILLRNNGTIEYLSEGGIILGISDNTFPYTEGDIIINNDDLLLLYTDGVTEALNAEKEEFGEENLIDVIRNIKELKSEEILLKISEKLKEFSKGTSQSDDITMVSIKKVT
ncbi:MAG TPA: SpoIIE family protein phosphatase [Candidatus Kapabacteria bacterium]|nr:SpoIIE family protein phosphatase [Candidatus Kapabacteria bacterium]